MKTHHSNLRLYNLRSSTVVKTSIQTVVKFDNKSFWVYNTLMMTLKRKSIPKITERALRKCEQFYMDGVHAYCTPAEYLALCWYFGTKQRMMYHYEDLVKKGDSRPSNHYFHVKKWDRVFPKSEYAILDCSIDHTSPYY